MINLINVHIIIYHLYFSKETSEVNDDISQHLEDFLTLMSGVLGEKRFLADYEGQFSFQDDIDILCQAAGDMYPFEAKLNIVHVKKNGNWLYSETCMLGGLYLKVVFISRSI